MSSSTAPSVTAVHTSRTHSFSKFTDEQIRLVAGLGVEDDAHAGVTVQHRSRIARTPNAPNLRQVHLMHSELFDELVDKGFVVSPGDLGENVTTRGIDLLGLPTGTRLHLGDEAVVEITGLRNPCSQIDRFERGLMAATLDRKPDGSLVRKAGVMAIVLVGGELRAGDGIRIELPPEPHRALEAV